VSEGADRYLVLLEEDPFIDPRLVADEVARIHRIPPLEARRRVRGGVGIVAEDLGEGDAAAILQRLAEAGVAARVVLAEALPPLPPVEVFSVVATTPEGLELTSSDGAEEAMAVWEQIELVNVAILSERGYVDRGGGFETRMIPGMHDLEPGEAEVVRENLILRGQSAYMRGGSEKEPILAQLEGGKLKRHSAAADLVGRQGACWFRVPCKHLVHRQGRLKLGAELGFARFVRQLGEKCEKRALSPLTLKVLSGDDIRSVTLAGQAEMTRHTRWQLYLKLTETTG
jgi:hypothetical protein